MTIRKLPANPEYDFDEWVHAWAKQSDTGSFRLHLFRRSEESLVIATEVSAAPSEVIARGREALRMQGRA